MVASHNIINLKTVLKRNDNLIFNSIDDEVVILSVLNEEYYYLNQVGSRIWKYLNKPESLESIISMLLEEFEISFEKCSSETTSYIRELYSIGVLEITDNA